MELTVPFSSYKYLRLFAVIAGLLGVAQSLAWLGLSVTAIVAYFCHIDFLNTTANYGALLQVTIFEMYFRGECVPNAYPVISFAIIEDLSLTTPQTVNIFMWTMAALSLIWLFSSVTLLSTVKKSNLKYLNTFLYAWILITFVISMVDLVLFVLFIIDYNTILQHSFNFSLNFGTSVHSILIVAQNTAGMMASVALRGYLLWLINLVLTVYLFTQTFRVYDYNRMKEISRPAGQVNIGFKSDDELKAHSMLTNPPIDAFETRDQQPHHPWYTYLTTDIPRVQRPNTLHPAPPPPMSRSKSANNLDESFQRRQTMAPNAQAENNVVYRREQVQRELKDRQSVNNIQTSTLPNHNHQPQPRSAMRNSRYQ